MAQLIPIAIAGTLLLGCLTPEEKHRLLTFFFDDVPPLEQEVDLEAPLPGEADLAAAERVRAIRRRALIVSVHGPYAIKACDECHDNRYEHSSRLVGPKEDLCWKCHEEEDFPGSVVHAPMAARQCDGCHDPHRTKFPTLLVASREAICERCHDEDTFPEADQHRAEQGEDCLGCHHPHAADRDYMLIEAEESS